MITKRNSYDDEIPFHCEDCGEDFTIEGYVERYHTYTTDEARIIPADGGAILCPNDHDWTISYRTGRQVIPSHDVSYTGGI